MADHSKIVHAESYCVGLIFHIEKRIEFVVRDRHFFATLHEADEHGRMLTPENVSIVTTSRNSLILNINGESYPFGDREVIDLRVMFPKVFEWVRGESKPPNSRLSADNSVILYDSDFAKAAPTIERILYHSGCNASCRSRSNNQKFTSFADYVNYFIIPSKTSKPVPTH